MNYLVMALAAFIIIAMIGIRIGHFYYNKHMFLSGKSYDFSGENKAKIFWAKARQYILYGLCTFFIIWYVVFRYIPLFPLGVEQGWLNNVGKFASDQTKVNYNKGWSMVLMLDLCTLFGILVPVVILIDRKQIITPAIASLSILGALLTFFGGFWDVEAPWTFEYLLFGTWDSNFDLPVSFIIHSQMLGLGLYVLLWKRRWVFKDNIYLCSIGFSYLLYVLSVTSGMQISTHATALVKNDFIPLNSNEHAIYAIFMDMFGVPSDNWRLGSAIAWISFFVISNVCLPPLNIFASYKQSQLNMINDSCVLNTAITA